MAAFGSVPDAGELAGIRTIIVLIVALEGDDPFGSFSQTMAAKDAFTTEFLERFKAVHGVDLTP